MSSLTQLSVVLPVLNERDNLAELIPELCSALSPVLEAVEIIVVDDSSTDGTDLLLADLASRDARIRYVSRKGQPASLPDSLTDGVIRNLRNSNDSLSAVLLSRVLNRYLWLLLGRCCRDLASGFIVANKESVIKIGLRGSYGDYCVRFIYLAHRLGNRIVEVPYVCQVRRHGYSKTGTTLWGLIKRGAPYVVLPLGVRRAHRK